MDPTACLVRLHETDLGIMRAHKRLEDLPERRAILQLRKKITELEALAARADAAVHALDRDVAREEDSAQALDDKIAHEQEKILSGSVTNPKELQALSRELDALKRAKDKADGKTLEVMEKLETARGQAARIREHVAEGHRKEEAMVAAFRSKGGTLQSEIERLEKERATLSGAVDPDSLSRYEDARVSKHGIGLGVLEGDTCSACRVALPADRLHSLRCGPPVGTCPACRRVLVVTPMEAE
ncbi:MAG: hypothetical protein WC971_02415 [Coriobacteriia bacterium]